MSFLLLARPWRWALLGLLAVVSAAWAAWRRSRPRLESPALALALGLLAAAFASAAWSVDPWLTLGRGVAFAAVLVSGIALALACAGRPRVVARLLHALLAGALVVAALSALLYVSFPDRAVQHADTQSPARYMGLGGNPNTLSMLCAIALPLALWALRAARTPAGRAGAAAAGILLDGSIAASGSRGAMIAATVGLACVALALPWERRRRLALVGGVLALFAVNVAVSQIPQPERARPRPPQPQRVAPESRNAESTLALADELGGSPRPYRRKLFGTSGRAEAWRGAVGQAADRPLAGYGFGTEERVFVDRYRNFLSALPENSYLGVLLQLGVAGLALVVALLTAVLVTAARAIRMTRDPCAAACVAVLLAGVTLALTQSYLTSAGNIACLTLWTAAFLGTSLAPRARPRRAQTA
ncbi:MAG: O-Antigen ligase [Thermoleophilaceae bacterium]|nr:O-Antigen ligase [Thermoleophilaceae bacterium]